jgi:hypothetical protein
MKAEKGTISSAFRIHPSAFLGCRSGGSLTRGYGDCPRLLHVIERQRVFVLRVGDAD